MFKQTNNYQKSRNYNSNEMFNILSNNSIKQIIINFIYNSLRPYSNYLNSELIKQTDLNNITSDNYVVQYRYKGEPSFLLFYRNKDRYYSCIINKKYLMNDPKDIIIESVHLIPFEIMLEIKIYEGTLIDGIYFVNKENKSSVFYVSDVYKFRGENRFKDNINNKFIELEAYLNHFKQNKLILSPRDEMINIKKFYDSCKSNTQINGISFYPFISGNSYVYHFNKSAQNTKIYKNKQIRNIKTVNIQNYQKQEKRYIINPVYLKTNEKIIVDFEVRNQKLNNSLFDIYINNVFVSNLFLNLTNHKKLIEQINKNKTNKNYSSCEYDKINNRWKYLEKANNESDDETIKKYFITE